MSEILVDIDQRTERIQQSKAPAIEYGMHIFPVSHDKFLARWLLSQESIKEGLQASSHIKEEAYLILRAYSLPADANPGDFSSSWSDYSIEGAINSAQFTLPTSAAKINAAVGIINKAGHFSPIHRAMAMALPAPPPAPTPDRKLCPEAKPFKASGG